MPKYRWIITDDLTGPFRDAVGVEGPSSCDTNLVSNEARFEIFDDDNHLCYIGKLFGDYDGFEPLDDFGMPNAGCTAIKINGELL